MGKFENNKCQIYDKNKSQIITIEMTPHKIFPLKMTFEEKLALTLINDESTSWHLRFRHLKFNSLKLLM